MVARPLVLLPGLLCDQVLWRHQIETLTQDDTISAMAERVLDQTPRTFCLAGLSMGGYVAQEIMRKAPEREERLAMIDTNARARYGGHLVPLERPYAALAVIRHLLG